MTPRGRPPRDRTIRAVPPSPRASNRLERNFAAAIRRHPERPRIVSEGDSWFSFPFPDRGNLIDRLEPALRRAALLRLERTGDTMAAMLSARAKRRLGFLLGRYAVDLLLFSGGGNDVLGAPGFDALLRPRAEAASWRDCLVDRAVADRLDAVDAGYRELFALRDAFRRGCAIVVHGYDYPVPADRGIRQLGVRLRRPWMHPAMTSRGIVDPAEQRAIARELIDRFAGRLRALADAHERVTLVDLRGTLGDGDWGDEIHPSRAGFAKLARVLEREVRTLVPDAFA